LPWSMGRSHYPRLRYVQKQVLPNGATIPRVVLPRVFLPKGATIPQVI
jgi:hypothetical protein